MNYSSKKKYHTAKIQLIANGRGNILQIDVDLTQVHDVKLFKQSKQCLHNAKFILADSGYQSIKRWYKQAFTPIKASKKHPLCDEAKHYNRLISSYRVKTEHLFAKLKTFKIFATSYCNHLKRFGLRVNLAFGLIGR